MLRVSIFFLLPFSIFFLQNLSAAIWRIWKMSDGLFLFKRPRAMILAVFAICLARSVCGRERPKGGVRFVIMTARSLASVFFLTKPRNGNETRNGRPQTYLVEASDEGRHAVFRLDVTVAPRREICRAMAQVVDGRDAIEQLVLSFAQLERHFFWKLQEPLEGVELVRKGRREGEHPPRQRGRRCRASR